MGPFRRPKWSSICGGLDGAAPVRRGQATVAVCGDQLDGPIRAALSSSGGTASGETEKGDGVQVVVIEQLCAHPERLGAFCERHRPRALVAAACSLGAARAALHEAVAAGADTARVVPRSLAPALGRSEPERTFVLAASCRAWSRRALTLAGAPLAGHRPWRSGEPLDRRSLLGAWSGQPSTSARIDPGLCAGADRCGRCVRDCPSAAITVTGSLPEVDPLGCTSCGRCVATCPSHAISMPGADLDGIAAELDSLFADGLREVSITCERSGAAREDAHARIAGAGATPSGSAGSVVEAEILLPCVAVLGPGVLISLSDAGVQVDVGACRNCPSHSVVDATARFAGRLAGVLGAGGPDMAGEPLWATAPPLGWYEPEATNAVVTRASVAKTHSGGGYGDEGGGGVDHGGSQGVMLDPGAATFVVGVDGALCSMCGSCSLACAATAIAYHPNAHVLEVDSSRCVGCGRCVTVCPESAVSVERGIDMDAVVTGPSPVAAAPRAQAGSERGGYTGADPLVAAVERRLAARGRPSALLASLSAEAARPPRARGSDLR